MHYIIAHPSHKKPYLCTHAFVPHDFQVRGFAVTPIAAGIDALQKEIRNVDKTRPSPWEVRTTEVLEGSPCNPAPAIALTKDATRH
jgi:hypothetical protein